MGAFFDEINGVSRRGPRFFVPGHKGNFGAVPAFGAALRLDITEVDGAGDLSRPAGALAASEGAMACLYGSGATLYSASGATSCVQAMLALFVGMGDTVVMARGCHVSAVRALAMLDAGVHWVPLCGGTPAAADIEAALIKSGAAAAYITSPDYYGRMADVPAIAEACHRHNAVLLVDNAHGAYLRFFPGRAPGASALALKNAKGQEAVPFFQGHDSFRDLHPLTLGADAAADSAHKTLPCLTPAAMLHLRSAEIAGPARAALNLFCSTSPSYLVLASLDLAVSELAQNLPDFAAAAGHFGVAASSVAAAVCPCADPLRLCLRPGKAGVDAGCFYRAMLDAGVAPEYFDGECFVLMASPWNTEADFAWLKGTFENISRNLTLGLEEKLSEFHGYPKGTSAHGVAEALPKADMTVRQALFAKKQRLPTGETVGRLCADLTAPCPPGTPLVMPGEMIDAETASRLAAGGILSFDVVK